MDSFQSRKALNFTCVFGVYINVNGQTSEAPLEKVHIYTLNPGISQGLGLESYSEDRIGTFNPILGRELD